MIEFISRLPQGYQEVEYIESSGTQYIDTGYKPTSNNLRVVCDFEYTADHSASSVFGSESSGKYSIVPWGAPEFYVGSSTQLLAQTTALNTKYALDAHANAGTLTVSLNGTTNSASYSGSILTTVNMGIFCNIVAGVASQFCSMKLYAMYIYDNSNLVRDFVPCYRKSDNVAGLYDLVNNVFYTNAGSGVFAVGADSNKRAVATIIPGGVISFGAALRRRMMMAGGGGVPISDLPLGTLINVGTDGGTGTPNYEIADINNLVHGGVVLVRKNIYSKSRFGSNTNYPNGTLDNLIKTTIYNKMPQQLRDKMMYVSFNLSGCGNITRKMFAPTYTMLGFGNNNGGAEGKALQLYTNNTSRVKTFDDSAGYWWPSSRYTISYVWLVSVDGSTTNGSPSASYGVVPAFVVPQSVMLEDSANTDGSYNLKFAEKISCTVNMGSTEEMPKSALPIINCNGNLTLQICNNANDAAPAWEAAANETVHNFTNTAKTAAQWAIGLEIDITRTAGENLFLNEPVVLTM